MMKQDNAYRKFVESQRDKGLLRKLVSIKDGARKTIHINNQQYINFSSNDYLSLSQHAKLKDRARDFLERYGAGSAASRLVTGNLEPFDKIEAKVAKLKKKPAALIMASGFQANAAVLQALFDKSVLDETPIVYADRLNHSSMHFGCAAAQVRQSRYRHLDITHLEELLKKDAKSNAPKFILTESVFSMDGDIAPIQQICALAHTYDCQVICDDAHATGILGDKGAGLSGDADIVIGTFSKAMGSFGAYVACSETVRDYLINRCTGLIYSTALPPATLGAIDAALDLLPDLDDQRTRVAQLANSFRDFLQSQGFDTAASRSQIVPLIIGDEDTALSLSTKLRNNGLWVTAIRPPTVPKGTARLRFAFCAHHDISDLEKLITVI